MEKEREAEEELLLGTPDEDLSPGFFFFFFFFFFFLFLFFFFSNFSFPSSFLFFFPLIEQIKKKRLLKMKRGFYF